MCCKIQNLLDQSRSCWLSCTVDSGHPSKLKDVPSSLDHLRPVLWLSVLSKIRKISLAPHLLRCVRASLLPLFSRSDCPSACRVYLLSLLMLPAIRLLLLA